MSSTEEAKWVFDFEKSSRELSLVDDFHDGFRWTEHFIENDAIVSLDDDFTPFIVNNDQGLEYAIHMSLEIDRKARICPFYRISATYLASICRDLVDSLEGTLLMKIPEGDGGSEFQLQYRMKLLACCQLLARDFKRINNLLNWLHQQDTQFYHDESQVVGLFRYAADYLCLPRPFFKPDAAQVAKRQAATTNCLIYDKTQFQRSMTTNKSGSDKDSDIGRSLDKNVQPDSDTKEARGLGDAARNEQDKGKTQSGIPSPPWGDK